MNKDELRSWAQAERAAVDVATVSAAIVERLAEIAPESWPVVIFDAMPGEIDVSALGGHGFELAYTRSLPGGVLSVHRPGASMERHRYGFRQPAADAPELPLAEIGAVVVPGLVFDRRGHRVGWGAGYYDRFLGSLPEHVITIGVVAEALLVAPLPIEGHDIPVDVVVTDVRTVLGDETD